MKFWQTVIALGLVAVIGAVAQPAWKNYQEWLNTHHARFLAQRASSGKLGGRKAVREIRQLPESMAELARLAASERDSVSASAREAINAKLTIWRVNREQFGVDQAIGPELQRLAELLAEHTAQLSRTPAVAAWARRTAKHLLQQAEYLPSDRFLAITRDVERILANVPIEATQAASASLPSPTRAWNSEALASEAAVEFARQAQPDAPATLSTPPTASSQQTNLPWIPGAAGIADANQRRTTVTITPTPLVEPVQDNGSPTQPLPIPGPDPELARHAMLDNDRRMSTSGGGFLDVPPPDQLRHVNRELGTLPTAELRSKLNAPEIHPFVAAAIQRELARRNVAQGAASPQHAGESSSPARVEQPRSAKPPVTTLERLRSQTRHADPSIRRQALSLLATSNDPRLPQLALERALYDEDPQVAETASRILESTGKALR